MYMEGLEEQGEYGSLYVFYFGNFAFIKVA